MSTDDTAASKHGADAETTKVPPPPGDQPELAWSLDADTDEQLANRHGRLVWASLAVLIVAITAALILLVLTLFGRNQTNPPNSQPIPPPHVTPTVAAAQPPPTVTSPLGPSVNDTASMTSPPVNVIPLSWTGLSHSPNEDGTVDSLPVTLVLDSSDPISGVMSVIGPQHTCTFQLSEAMRSSATNRVVNGYNTTGPCGGDNVTWSVVLKPDQMTGTLMTHPQNTFTLKPG